MTTPFDQLGRLRGSTLLPVPCPGRASGDALPPVASASDGRAEGVKTEEPEDGRRPRAFGPKHSPRAPRSAARETVPIARVFSLAARVPLREHPDRFTVADVPILALPVVGWSRATSGDSLADLLGLIQNQGGRWVARHTGTTVSRSGLATPSGLGRPAASVPREVRVDGAGSGQFLASAQPGDVAEHLRALARSPILGFVPDEIADGVIPAVERDKPLSWLGLSRLLDDVLNISAPLHQGNVKVCDLRVRY